MRGAVPNGVLAPRGETSVMVPPTLTRSSWASRVPMAMPSCLSKPSSVPSLDVLGDERAAPSSRSSSRPRTLPPSASAGVEAMTWPSIRGTACLTPATPSRRLATSGVVGKLVGAYFVGNDMAVEAQDLVEQLLAEAVHHRHHDDERGDAQQDAEEGEAGDDRDEAFLAPRPQVAQGQHPLERSERPGIDGGQLSWGRVMGLKLA